MYKFATQSETLISVLDRPQHLWGPLVPSASAAAAAAANSRPLGVHSGTKGRMDASGMANGLSGQFMKMYGYYIQISLHFHTATVNLHDQQFRAQIQSSTPHSVGSACCKNHQVHCSDTPLVITLNDDTTPHCQVRYLIKLKFTSTRNPCQ